ncbi:MAG: hypothetical protein ABEJ95_05585 [Candidatus Nanohalobium sp.]
MDLAEKEEKLQQINPLEKENGYPVKALALTAVVLAASIFLALNNTSEEDKIVYDREIVIDNSVMPYRTSMNRTGVAMFTNKETEQIQVTFEPYQIEKKLSIPANSSRTINFSRYSHLPRKNYFHIGDSTGQIILK